jgi:hypothetical protein
LTQMRYLFIIQLKVQKHSSFHTISLGCRYETIL